MTKLNWWTAVLVGLSVLPNVAASADPATEAVQKGKACFDKEGFGPEPITLNELPLLLWATQGVSEPVNENTVLRTVPSAGNPTAFSPQPRNYGKDMTSMKSWRALLAIGMVLTLLGVARANSPTPFTTILRVHLKEWSGASGTITPDQLDRLMKQRKIHGEAAAVLAAMKLNGKDKWLRSLTPIMNGSGWLHHRNRPAIADC